MSAQGRKGQALGPPEIRDRDEEASSLRIVVRPLLEARVFEIARVLLRGERMHVARLDGTLLVATAYDVRERVTGRRVLAGDTFDIALAVAAAEWRSRYGISTRSRAGRR